MAAPKNQISPEREGGKETNLQNDSGDKKGAEQLAKKGALAWKRLNSQTGISSFLPLGARTDLTDIQQSEGRTYTLRPLL